MGTCFWLGWDCKQMWSWCIVLICIMGSFHGSPWETWEPDLKEVTRFWFDGSPSSQLCLTMLLWELSLWLNIFRHFFNGFKDTQCRLGNRSLIWSLSLFFRMVRSCCPVILVHLFSYFVGTRGRNHLVLIFLHNFLVKLMDCFYLKPFCSHHPGHPVSIWTWL